MYNLSAYMMEIDLLWVRQCVWCVILTLTCFIQATTQDSSMCTTTPLLLTPLMAASASTRSEGSGRTSWPVWNPDVTLRRERRHKCKAIISNNIAISLLDAQQRPSLFSSPVASLSVDEVGLVVYRQQLHVEETQVQQLMEDTLLSLPTRGALGAVLSTQSRPRPLWCSLCSAWRHGYTWGRTAPCLR